MAAGGLLTAPTPTQTGCRQVHPATLQCLLQRQSWRAGFLMLAQQLGPLHSPTLHLDRAEEGLS